MKKDLKKPLLKLSLPRRDLHLKSDSSDKKPPVSETGHPDGNLSQKESNSLSSKNETKKNLQEKAIKDGNQDLKVQTVKDSGSPSHQKIFKKKNLLKPQKPKKPFDKKQILKLDDEIKTLQNRYLYLKADFENYKKQMLKEKSELIRYGGEHFIRTLIDEVLDDFDRAYSTLENTKSLENFKQGIDLIYKNFKKTLYKFHIKSQNPEGKLFDPTCHEALGQQPTDQVPKDHILVTFKKSYTLYDKLIRPAQVLVAASIEDSSDEK